jgi:spermidine synthase
MKDAAARPFETLYYSAAIHQAALALPPFVEKALAK